MTMTATRSKLRGIELLQYRVLLQGLNLLLLGSNLSCSLLSYSCLGNKALWSGTRWYDGVIHMIVGLGPIPLIDEGSRSKNNMGGIQLKSNINKDPGNDKSKWKNVQMRIGVPKMCHIVENDLRDVKLLPKQNNINKASNRTSNHDPIGCRIKRIKQIG